MADKSLPMPEVLRQLLRYEPETGKLFWKERPPSMFTDGKYSAARNAAAWNSRYADAEAFTTVDNYGYRQGAIFNRHHRAHRVTWALVYGVWPTLEVDHINGVKTDNRLANLREASKSENGRNREMRADNTSGFKGVIWDRSRDRWRAKITLHGRCVDLGYFNSKTDAARAYDTAALARHGEFARLNFPKANGVI